MKTVEAEARVLPISVVIPAYNAAAFLGEALKSVLAQTRPPSEIIVVDDGSSDESAAIARGCAAKVLRQEHLGLSAARNTGICAASERWVAFLDADDVWESDKLERQWVAVEACPDVGLVFTDFVEFDSKGVLEGSFLDRMKHYAEVDRKKEVAAGVMCPDEQSFQAQFLRGNFIAPSTVLARRDLLIDVGLFDTGLKYVEDRELWLRVFAVAKVAVVERALMRSRLHASNMSNDRLEMARGVVMVAERVCANPGRYLSGAAQHYRGLRPKLYLNAGRLAEDRGEVVEARTYYLHAWRSGGGLRPLALAVLSRFPTAARRLARVTARTFRSGSGVGERRP